MTNQHNPFLILTFACAFLISSFCSRASAETVTAIYSFTGGADGAGVWAGLVEASDGNLYGTTTRGGTQNTGTVFRVTKNGVLTSLYSFTGGGDGAMPVAGLIQAHDGHLYGTASAGANGIGFGTVFRITTSGALTTLYAFNATSDGAFPFGGLVQATNGDLYGTTFGGVLGYGTIFRLSTNRQFTLLHAFTNGVDGAKPEKAALIQARDGHLYGTTSKGGAYGHGTLFRITLDGVLTPLYSFTGDTDGSKPVAGLTEGRDGYFYGTASQKGAFNFGTAYRIDSSGAFKLLHTFTNRASGIYPMSNLIEMSDGYFYGVTQQDNIDNYGTIFGVNAAGDFKVVSTFNEATGGRCAPSIGLTRGSDGNLYGTANAGGANLYGTVFRVAGGPITPVPVQLQARRIANTHLEIAFSTVLNLNYAVEVTTNLVSPQWLTVTNVTGNGEVFQFTAPFKQSSAAFYRALQH